MSTNVSALRLPDQLGNGKAGEIGVVIGVVAMLWVGGHILLVGVDDLGWHAPYELVHHLEEAVAGGLGALSGFVTWLVNTLSSAVIGLVVGAVVVAVMHLVPRTKKDAAAH